MDLRCATRERAREAAKVRALVVAGQTLAALFSSTSSRAQGNSFAAPLGGRSALMGNTGTALAVDGAAPFLNPATIVRMDDQRFAFSVNFYQYANTQFDNWHKPGAVDTPQFGNLALGDTDIRSSGFSVLPSTLCLFFTVRDGAPGTSSTTLHPGRQKISVCLASTESEGLSFTALPFTGTTPYGVTIQAESLVQTWNRLYIGPSYSLSLSEHVALGVALHGVYTTDSFALASSAITSAAANGGVESSFGVAGAGGSLDVAGTLGVIYHLASYTAGLSVAFPALHVLGSYTGSLNSAFRSGSAGSATISEGSGSFSAAPPIRVALGVGAERGRLSVEADAAMVIPAPSGFTADLTGNTVTLTGNTVKSSTFQSGFGEREHVVVNPSVGAEYFVTPTFSVIGGASLNMTLEPPLTTTLSIGNLGEERQSLVTLAAGVGSYTSSGNLLFGAQLGHGWGESLAPNSYVTPNAWGVADTSSYEVLLILAGSTSLRSIERAAQRVEHVFDGKPDNPAASPAPAPDAVPTTPGASR